MARMHRGNLASSLPIALCSILCGIPTACAHEDDQLVVADVLELHVGADYEPLSQALQRPPPGAAPRPAEVNPAGAHPAGVENEPAPVVPEPPADADATPARPRLDPQVRPDPRPTDPKAARPPLPKPEPKPTPAQPAFRTVVLQAGQTLYGLCRTELGDGGRWKEVARLNGWSESQAGSLPEGQRVKLPVARR